MVNALHEGFAFHALTTDIHLHETAVLVQWDSGMIEQEAVAHEEETTMLVQHTQVLLYLLRLTERSLQLLHQLVLLLR